MNDKFQPRDAYRPDRPKFFQNDVEATGQPQSPSEKQQMRNMSLDDIDSVVGLGDENAEYLKF